jgi:hypothetical protein
MMREKSSNPGVPPPVQSVYHRECFWKAANWFTDVWGDVKRSLLQEPDPAQGGGGA